MKLTAAIAIPTPKRTPARTRFEPPSPNAKVRPDTTIATRESPRAMVLVKACCRTATAFSHGELPVACAKAGSARKRLHAAANKKREREAKGRKRLRQYFVMASPFNCESAGRID